MTGIFLSLLLLLQTASSPALEHLHAGVEAERSGQLDAAVAEFQQAAELDPKRASPHMLAGEALQAKGDLAAALKEFEISRDDDSMNTRIHWDLMRAYNAAGRTNDAKREKDEIEKLSRSDSNNSSPRGDKSE